MRTQGQHCTIGGDSTLSAISGNQVQYSSRRPFMFSIATAAPMASGCAIVLLMPGPTNTLLAAAGLKQDLRRSAHLTVAELAGYLVSISLWRICLTHASHSPGCRP